MYKIQSLISLKFNDFELCAGLVSSWPEKLCVVIYDWFNVSFRILSVACTLWLEVKQHLLCITLKYLFVGNNAQLIDGIDKAS